MYNITTIQNSLKSLIAFKQTRTADIEVLKDFLLTTDSGRYFQEYHPLLNLVNIDASAPDFDSYDTPVYAGGTNYLKGEIVLDTTLFRSVKGTNTTPNVGNLTSDTEWWIPFGYLSGYLEDIVLAAIPKVINKIFVEKKKVQNMREPFADLKLYQGSGNFVKKVTKQDRFCGMAVNFKYMKDLIMSVDQIGLQVDTAQNPITIYIYHSSQEDAIYSFDITVTKVLSFGWYSLLDANGDNPVLAFVNNNINAGGEFYIGYYEADITGQFIDHNIDLSKVPCGGCSPANQRMYKSWNQFVDIHTFSVSDDYTDAITYKLWDITKNSYNYDTNWGLNLSLRVTCELSDFIVRNKQIFTEAIGFQVAHDLIYEQAYSTQNNALAEKNRKLALYELDDRDSTAGLMKQLDDKLEALNIDLSSLNSKCLSEYKKKGIKFGAI